MVQNSTTDVLCKIYDLTKQHPYLLFLKHVNLKALQFTFVENDLLKALQFTFAENDLLCPLSKIFLFGKAILTSKNMEEGE